MYNDANWQSGMRLKVDFNNMMAERLSGGEGIAPGELEARAEAAAKAYVGVAAKRGQGMMGWTELPYNQDAVVADIEGIAANCRKYGAFVVLGIGGSALGPMAVQQALNPMRWNELPDGKRNGPRLYIEDNVDPERMASLLDVIDLNDACFNVISKSGNTSETAAQFLIVRDLLRRKLGEREARERIICTTSANSGNLIKIARAEGYQTLFIPDGVGGRFSEMCPVGLLAAAVCGIDIRQMLAGAAYMDALCRERDWRKNPALLTAVLMDLAMKKGKNISVMMPYADSLKYMADWYCQLWGESLGKLVNLQGKTVHAGQTPVKSLGVTDQHSQIQLYAEGPFDKVITFLGVERYRDEVAIPQGFAAVPEVNFLSGHTMNELIHAEQFATAFALTKAGKMNMTITLPEVNAFTVGELLFFFEMQTAFTGELMGIDAFNQPGVEEGKNATYALLGRPGYGEKRAELDAQPSPNPGYTV